MCMMGSPMESTMVLSTSVFSPIRVSLAGRLSFLVMSRTIRVIFWNTLDTGTMRRDMDTSWSSSVSLRSCRADLEKASSTSPFRSGEEVTMDSVMTISPTTADSWSSLDRLTLMRVSLGCCCCCCWAAGAEAAAGAGEGGALWAAGAEAAAGAGEAGFSAGGGQS